MALTLLPTAKATPTLIVGAAPRVNLMPRSETQRREQQALIRRWGWALLAAAAVVGLATGGTFWMQATSQQRLDTAEARTQELVEQIAVLQPVAERMALETEMVDMRATAMAADLSWTSLTDTVTAELPTGVTLIGFSLTPGGVPVGDDPSLEVAAAGTLKLASESPLDVVALVRQLRGVDGILLVDNWAAGSEGAGTFAYTIRVVFDQSFYTNAYAEEEAR